MSKRLQVVLSDEEMEVIQRDARRHGVTVSDWIRQAVRRAHRETSSGDIERKLAAIREAAQYSFPAPDIDQMLEEIEQGYASGLP